MRIAVIHHISATENDYGFYVSDLLSEYAAWLGYEVQLLEDFIFYANKTKSLADNAVIGIHVKASSSMGLRWWYSAKLPSILAQIRAHVVVNLNGVYSRATKIPQVLAFSDVTFLGEGEKNKSTWQRLVAKNLAAYAGGAATIFTYSKHAAGAIEKKAAKAPHIIPFCAGKDYKVWEWHEKVLTKSEFTEGKEYFICVLDDENAGLWLTLLKSFSRFKKWQQSTMQLILLPKHEIVPLKIVDKMATYKYRDDVQMLDNLSEKEKASLFGCAYAVIHVPANDADLLPVVEALACATPVIVTKARSESLEEYGKDTSITLEKPEAEALGDAVINIFKNEEQKTKMAENAKAQAAEIKRDDIAKLLWEIIETAAKG
ncbi:MAG TPA: glycosyltransferase [Chitinophagaceae bacterium]|nr:glycosyltransferase [Chitinophagaceae bacterium]